MTPLHTQEVIKVLTALATAVHFDAAQLDAAIDNLEAIKQAIDADDDEAIDTVDEIQDYLQYLLAVEEPSMTEIKAELAAMLDELQKQ